MATPSSTKGLPASVADAGSDFRCIEIIADPPDIGAVARVRCNLKGFALVAANTVRCAPRRRQAYTRA